MPSAPASSGASTSAAGADLDRTIDANGYPYGVQAFDDFFPGGRNGWVVLFNPAKQAELTRKRWDEWRKYLSTEKDAQAQRAQAEKKSRELREKAEAAKAESMAHHFP